jgi:hypothetical protein
MVKSAILGCWEGDRVAFSNVPRQTARKEEAKMKHRNKVWLLVTALAFVFSAIGLGFVQPAAAATGEYLSGNAIPPNDGSAYEVGGTSSGPIHVTLVIEAGVVLDEDGYVDPVAGPAFRKEISADISGTSNTVTSLLHAVDGTNDLGLVFKGRNNQGTLIAFTNSTDYLAAVVSDDVKWVDGSVALTYAFNGWVVRINDKFPVRKISGRSGEGWEGTNILQTPIVSGDVVHLFYDMPSDLYKGSGSSEGSGNIAANYVRAVYKNFANNTLTVQLQGHKTYIDPNNNNIMNVYNYFNLGAGVTASLYNENGIPVKDNNNKNLLSTSNANGEVTFTSNSLTAGGKYIVKTTSTYYHNTDPDWDERVGGAFFVLTGAYSKIAIPLP